ncbi:hypothetical protein RCH09_002463 [Actimicrobium sp. GrIS 1.19]|uniref:hypothetical protein n=1 Tax=Actimicrobium sp. GrIS 1.19 TaxID=3071708 RepID=UPI002DFF2002|nr:hypothetical protein [Actimicrobium sp. GrIS 1.19]
MPSSLSSYACGATTLRSTRTWSTGTASPPAGDNSIKRSAGTLVAKEPEQFDRLEFALGEDALVDYGGVNQT